MVVKLYTTHCPKCKVLERKLDTLKINYEVCDNVDEVLHYAEENGLSTAPILEVDGVPFEFSEAIKVISEGA